MKEWKVLPTDPRFLELTQEQKEFLWDNFLIDHPEIEKKLNSRQEDEEFDKEWETLDDTSQEAQGHSQDVLGADEGKPSGDGLEPEIEAYQRFLEKRTDLELPDVYERLRAKGIAIARPPEENTIHIPGLDDIDVEDWEEEVDD